VALTKHTKRAVVAAVLVGSTAGCCDLFAGTTLVTGHSAALIAVVTGVVWLLSGVDSVVHGIPATITRLIGERAQSHPIGVYRAFVRSTLLPLATPIGYFVPISQIMVAISYGTGVLVLPAAIGALLLLGNIIVFQKVTKPRDDLVLLTVLQVVILITNPGGVPEIIDAFQK
jgi:hypothetical protein